MGKISLTSWLIIVMLGAYFIFSGNLKVSANDHSIEEEIALFASYSWLLLIDSGKQGESWDEAAEYFKNAVSRAHWQKSLNTVRKPLGKLIKRRVKSKKYYTTLPGAPDGEYAVIPYETSFVKKE